jgi:hypothetical protein
VEGKEKLSHLFRNDEAGGRSEIAACSQRSATKSASLRLAAALQIFVRLFLAAVLIKFS